MNKKRLVLGSIFTLLIGIMISAEIASAQPQSITESTWYLMARKINPSVLLIEAESSPGGENNTTPSQIEKKSLEHHGTQRNDFQSIVNSVIRLPVVIVEKWDEKLKMTSHMRLGTGIMIHPNGFFLTNNHVIEGATKIKVTMHDGKKYAAEVVSTEQSLDAALLKIKTDQPTIFTFLRVAVNPLIESGQWFISVGHPFGLPFGALQGIVSAPPPEDSLETIMDTRIIFRLAGTFPPGLSGAPVVNLKGQVVGMVFAAAGGTYSPGFALILEPVIRHFRNSGALPPLPKP